LIKRIEASSSSNETLQVLTEISDCPNFNDLTPENVRFLVNMFRKEKDFIRVKILYLLSDFVLEHDLDGSAVIEDILIMIKSEESSKVICQSFTSMLRVGQHGNGTISQALLNKVIEFAKLKLSSTNHNVQRHAISLIGAFASKEDAESSLLVLISHYMDSPDARCRAQAINSILCIGKRSIELSQSIYSRVEKNLKDDYECVRKESLQLMFEISQRHPDW
jgi:integrator complex subunit 4